MIKKASFKLALLACFKLAVQINYTSKEKKVWNSLFHDNLLFTPWDHGIVSASQEDFSTFYHWV